MASYQVMSWHGIPSPVKVTDEAGGVVSRQLPASFQQEIDRLAMAEGLIDSDAYLEGCAWSEPAGRDGTAEEVAEALVTELTGAWRPGEPPSAG